jgi:hypothetical protein
MNIRCLGVGVIGPDRSVAPTEVQCVTNSEGNFTVSISGRAVEIDGKPRIEITFETARGRKHEVVYR